MSITTIFSKNSPNIGGISFDATIEESAEFSAQSTDYPVESGAIEQDHIIQLPTIIRMVVSVSDHPYPDALETVLATAGGFIGSKLPPAVAAVGGLAASLVNAAIGSGSSITRSAAAWRDMIGTYSNNSIFDVQTSKATYKNVHITRLYHQTNSDNENIIDIVVEMKQIKTAETRLSGDQPSKDKLSDDDTAKVQASPIKKLGELTRSGIEKVGGLFG